MQGEKGKIREKGRGKGKAKKWKTKGQAQRQRGKLSCWIWMWHASLGVNCLKVQCLWTVHKAHQYLSLLQSKSIRKCLPLPWESNWLYCLGVSLLSIRFQFPAQNANWVLLGTGDACPDSFFWGFVFTLPLRNWLFLMTFMINKTVWKPAGVFKLVINKVIWLFPLVSKLMAKTQHLIFFPKLRLD